MVSGSGDNPCGLAGLGLSEEGTVAVSLGTSDTIMGITAEPRPQEEVCILSFLSWLFLFLPCSTSRSDLGEEILFSVIFCPCVPCMRVPLHETREGISVGGVGCLARFR